MPFILAFLASFVTTVMSWALNFFSKKARIVATTLAGYILIVAAFILCIKQAVTFVLALAILPSWIATGIGMFLPYNFATVLASILGARSCRYAYDIAVSKLKMVNSGT